MRARLRLLVCLAALAAPAAAQDITAVRLPNGIRLSYLQVPNSDRIAIFSFLPMGLAGDDAGCAGWSHLVEHLVLRTTMPDDLTNGNAETMADVMHLDYYGPAGSWREGLSHHKRWLEGLPFTAERLKIEVPRANAEADSTARNLATYKFAIAAWNQAFRHCRGHVNIKGDLITAKLPEIQSYRDKHLFVPDRTIVCAIGGVDPHEFASAAREMLGALKSKAKPRQPLAHLKPRAAQATWDLSARHLIWSWPVPGPDQTDKFAALMMFGRLLTISAASDPQSKERFGAFVGAGIDITTPEGSFFTISAALKPGATAQSARELLSKYLDAASRPRGGGFGQIAQSLAQELGPCADLLANMPGERWMAEAQLALMHGLSEFRYGKQRGALINSLQVLTWDKMTAVVREYLTPQRRTSLLFVPASTASRPASERKELGH